MRDIGKNIRQLRKERGMTQDELAEALFVTRQTVSNYETGRSRPDIDMLVLIGQVLQTDINTLVYGPPVPEDQRQSRRQLAVVGVIVLALTVVYAVLYPYCDRARQLLFPTPLLLLRLTVRPALFFLLGWFALQCAGVLLHLKPVYNRITKVLRIVFWVLLCLILLIPMPYIVWLLIGFIKSISSQSVAVQFPNIPVYTQAAMGIIYGLIKWPFAMTVLGGVSQLLGMPRRTGSGSAINESLQPRPPL